MGSEMCIRDRLYISSREKHHKNEKEKGRRITGTTGQLDLRSTRARNGRDAGL